MALKPLTNPEWATSNPTDPSSGQPAILTPSVGKIASGFLRHEYPPRQDLNWFFNLVSLWVTYLEEFTDEHEAELIGNTADIATNTADITTNETTLNQVIASYSEPSGLITASAGSISGSMNECRYLMLNDSVSGKGAYVSIKANFTLSVASSNDFYLSLGALPGPATYFEGFSPVIVYISGVGEVASCIGVPVGLNGTLRISRINALSFPPGSYTILGSFVGFSKN